MKSIVVLLAVFLLAVSGKLHTKAHLRNAIIEGVQKQNVTVEKRSSNSFDFFVLDLQWVPTLTSSFTIHGLWPENSDGSYPEDCSGASEFSTSAISDLETELNSVWPSDSETNSKFWESEWNEHGTCSGIAIHQYFQDAITLQQTFNVKSALNSAGITPGHSYTATAVKNAVKNYIDIDATPVLHCSTSSDTLEEIGLCISTTLDIINCPSSLGDYFTCPSTVSYPN